jgi:hypothetical protein
MTNSAHARVNIVLLLGILLSSAVTMLWLFWHYPLATGIATVAVLAALGISARLARSSDTDGLSSLDQRESGIH